MSITVTTRITRTNQQANPYFYIPFEVPAGTTRIDAALALFSQRSEVAVFRGLDAGRFADPELHSVGFEPFDILGVRLDGDASVDLVSLNLRWKDVSLLRSDGGDGFEPERRLAPVTDVRWIGAGDFDGNDTVELVFVSIMRCAVTRTSSISRTLTAPRLIVPRSLIPAFTVMTRCVGSVPGSWMRIVWEPMGTRVIVKLPSSSVWAPRRVPRMITLA